jgi:hypothetical protein
MKFLMPILLGTTCLTIAATPIMVSAEQPKASTYQPGFWQPKAQINPNLPTQVEVINQTGLPLQYGLTTDTSHPLSPGSSATLRDVPLPANLLINPTVSNRSLKYDIAVANNVVTVKIRQVMIDTPGDGAINIKPDGGIYIY